VGFSASAILLFVSMASAAVADHSHRTERAGQEPQTREVMAEPATSGDAALPDLLPSIVSRAGSRLAAWYERTPPTDRVTWGGMCACAVLGMIVLTERLVRLRRRKVLPAAFTARFLDRLHDGKLDCGQALDHCELNPSPAARVALAAVRRWGRPAADLERAVVLAHRVETEALRRNVGTLRRIAVLTPLLGLLGTLFALGRALEGVPGVVVAGAGPAFSAAASPLPSASRPRLGSELAMALTPLSTGIVIATIALVAYDGLLIRIEKLAGGLDRLGAETIDAIALAAPSSPPLMTLAPVLSRPSGPKPGDGAPRSAPAARVPHQVYVRADEGAEPLRQFGQPETGF
jgi:biopolymer transport protein ExbB